MVVTNYSRSTERAHDFANHWNIPHPSVKLDELIARDDIDLYIIALPNEEHLPVGLELARAGKNQVCTKPGPKSE